MDREAVQSNSSPAAPHGRFGWLDGLRAYAIFGVIYAHVGADVFNGLPSPGRSIRILKTGAMGGTLGVQLFFVISSLTVFYTLGRFPFSWPLFRAWLFKRFVRIAPLYYAAIPLFYLLGVAINRQHAKQGLPPLPLMNAKDILANLLFVNTWVRHANNNVIPGGWSISVEMMFYLIAPLMFTLLARKYAVVWLALIALLCLVLSHVAAGAPIVFDSYFYYWFPSQFPVILCGLALCSLVGKRLLSTDRIPKHITLISCLVGLCSALAALTIGGWKQCDYTVAIFFWGISFSCLTVLAHGVLRPWFGNKFAVWIGRISYSLYIVHFLALTFISSVFHRFGISHHLSALSEFFVLLVATFSLSIAMASATRYCIELPAIKWAQRISNRLAASQTQS